MDNHLCYHTEISQFMENNVPYYYLKYDKKTYFEDEIYRVIKIQDGRIAIQTQAGNFLRPKPQGPCNYLRFHDGRMEAWQCAFTPKARAEIETLGRNKLKEREIELLAHGLKAKYKKVDLLAVWISMIVLALAIGLLFYFVFGQGLPNVLSAENAGANTVQSHLINLAQFANQTVNATANATSNLTG